MKLYLKKFMLTDINSNLSWPMSVMKFLVHVELASQLVYMRHKIVVISIITIHLSPSQPC